ncbi:MAG: alpha/beta fold hydrolase [Acidimicrobiales bacterium]
MVLVHGAVADIDDFAMVEPLFAEQHNVWVYSRRGRGESNDGDDYSVGREIEDVQAVLDAAGGDAHLVGHSFGAYYALLAAPRARLRSLVLYEPPLHVDDLDPAWLDDVETALEQGDADRALETFLPVAGVTAQEVEAARSLPPVWAALRDGARTFPREATALRRDGAQMLREAGPPQVPTMYLYGEEEDAPVYPTLDEVTELLPTAELHGLSGQRHLAYTFEPDAFADAVLRFTRAVDT